ncbi:J domain-containing protein [bacterium]|nr:J domain-containing protein [bacterium]
MNIVKVKGHEIEVKITKSAYDRKAVLYANNIIEELKKLNIPRDDIVIKTNILGNKNFPAEIEFWADRHYLRFSYSMTKRFIDNLYVIMELIKLEVNEVLSGKKDFIEFIQTFTVESDRKEIGNDLKKAKNTLGLEENETDVDKINQRYKKLAREHHPDLGGNLEEFQKINKAHKLIKKEMGFQ